MKRLYRSKKNRKFAGIAGGLGDYYEVDPVLLRLFALAAILMTGFFPGVIAYIIATFIVPEEPDK